ncbi:hypothetical protein Droror1_Dr00021875 [Drosera rotundifolia]
MMSCSLYHVYKPFAESGHVLFLDEHRKQIPADELMSLAADERDLVQRIGFIRLSDPDGFLLSNELISAFSRWQPSMSTGTEGWWSDTLRLRSQDMIGSASL